MKRYAYISIILLFTIISLSLIRIGMMNNISITNGIALENTEREIAQYKKENALLKEKYLEASSFTNIEYNAKTMGFVEAKNQVYLDTPLPLALLK